MQEVKDHTALDQHVIRTLLYYDIFNYPLKSSEVFRFLGINSVSEKDVVDSLNSLVRQQWLSQFDEFYSLHPHEELVRRRQNGNAKAAEYLKIAFEKAAFIAKFPFVRAVMASGSLSKDYMDDNCDLDFFIVTKPGRLWISRTLLVLYKRVFLRNSHKLFCVNYFVDADHLEIEEKNLFTATELATVIPLYGAEYYLQLQSKNHDWLVRYFPNFRPRDSKSVPVAHSGLRKNLMERAIDVLFGSLLDRALMNVTLYRWRKIYEKKYNESDFKIAFKTTAHASKNHPRNFQRKVMERYQQKIEWFKRKTERSSEYE
jgi:hypothetical protein